MGPRLHRAAWAALPVAAVLLAFAPVVAGVQSLSSRDTARLYAPLRPLVVEALRAGQLPLWNPHEGLGKPLFAEGIHSVLHPVSLLGAALAPERVDVLILAYLAAAALGGHLLARALCASSPAAAGAGAAFALSGYALSMTGNLVFLAGLSSLPWLLAAARHAGLGARHGPAATALACACAFLSGDAQIAATGIVLGVALAADAGGRRGAGRALAGVAVGLLLAGVQLAATAELLPLVTRAGDLAEADRLRWPLAPARALEWLVPGLFRGPPSRAALDASGGWIEPVFAESVYLGAPLLLAAGLGARRGRTGLLLGIAALVTLWLALGHHLGARPALDWVPIWSRFRYSEKLMAPLTLAACALAALGIDAFGAARLPRGWWIALAATAGAAAAALAALLAAPGATTALARQLGGEAGTFHRDTLAAGLPHLLLGAVALLAIDRLAGARPRAAALAALVALAPLAASRLAVHLGSPDARGQAPALTARAGDPPLRVGHPAEAAVLPDELLDFPARAARSNARMLAPPTGAPQGIDALGVYGPFESRRLSATAALHGDGWVRAARRFGLTHVAVPLPHNLLDQARIALAVEGSSSARRDPEERVEFAAVSHRPWAFFAERAVAIPDEAEARALTALLTERGDDGTVVLETGVVPPAAAGRVLAVERGAEVVRVEAEALGPAVLVVQDAFWPGWRATVDGRPAEIMAADGLVRAVRWPAGRHRLEMTYQPAGVRLGLLISGLGAVALLALAAAGERQRPAA